MAAEFTIESCVHGYNIYQSRWTAVKGEELTCHREPANASNPFAVAVVKGSKIKGHVPWFYSCMCNLLQHRGGSLSCCIIGNHRYSNDLPQGGLQLPCTSKFSASRELIKKIKHCLNELEVVVTDHEFITSSTKSIEQKSSVQFTVELKISNQSWLISAMTSAMTLCGYKLRISL